MLKVNASLESPMQGLHSESFWMGMLCWATLRSDTYVVRKALVKYCKGAPKADLGGKGLNNNHLK